MKMEFQFHFTKFASLVKTCGCAGCAVSVASGSMLSEIVEGKTIEEVKEIARQVKVLLTDDANDIDLSALGDIEVLQGVRKFPVRIKCALLAWVTLIEGLESWQQSKSA